MRRQKLHAWPSKQHASPCQSCPVSSPRGNMNTSEWLIMSRLQHADSAQRIHKHCSEEWVTYTGALCSCSISHDMYMNNGSNNWEKPTDIFKIDSSADYFHNSSFSLEISTCLSKWRLHSRQSKTQRLFIHCQKWWTKAANPHSHEAGQQRLNFSLDWRIDDINVRLQENICFYQKHARMNIWHIYS